MVLEDGCTVSPSLPLATSWPGSVTTPASLSSTLLLITSKNPNILTTWGSYFIIMSVYTSFVERFVLFQSVLSAASEFD